MTASERAERPWLTIREASAILGVSSATLRRWTEAGDVEAFVTPGGHRRFARTAIADLLPAGPKRRRRLHELGEAPERIVRQYRRELAGARPARDWWSTLGESDRVAFREPGRRILASILDHLDAAGDGEEALAPAFEASARYGALARAHGMAHEDVTETFLHYRSPLLDELGNVGRRRRLTAADAAKTILAASRAFDRLLIACLEGYAAAAAAADGGPATP